MTKKEGVRKGSNWRDITNSMFSIRSHSVVWLSSQIKRLRQVTRQVMVVVVIVKNSSGKWFTEGYTQTLANN